MADKQNIPKPLYCIQHSRFTKQDGWRLRDLSLSLNGNIAVTGGNVDTHRTHIDLYTNVRDSDSRDRRKEIYSKEFEKYVSEEGEFWGRRLLFYPGSDTTILSGFGDKLEVIDLIQDLVIKSRKIKLLKHDDFLGQINCLSVRETDIFIGFLQSNQINVYDLIKLNEIKTIILQGIQDGSWPYDMTAMADRIFVCEVYHGEESNQRSLVFEEKNGRILSELTKPSDTAKWYVMGLALNITLNVIAVAWSQTYKEKRKGIDLIVFYSLLSDNNCNFLIVEVQSGIERIRISDRGDRIITGNHVTGEVKVYDVGYLFTYHHLRENLISQLQRDECVRLIDYFALPWSQADAILKSRTPKERLLLALEERGVIQPSNVDRLIEAFHELKFTSSCYYLVDFYRQTRRSRLVSKDSDLTVSFKLMESKLGTRSDGQEMTDENSQRWAGMISRINSRVDTLKSVGSIKYSREEKIGTGSSGSHIFGGKFGNKTVAVKKVIRENVQRESELYNLMKTKTMSNVLKILQIEEDDDFTYIVTDLCEYDLKAVIEDTKNPIGARLSPEKRVKLCVDILRGLRDLHSLGVIHRDLKPSNILVGVDGEAYVADFGISRNLSGETTHATGFYGTLCWIAREGMQSKNNKVRYKKESDVQVAGCLMYYVLSNGHHPFEATFPFINNTGKLMSNVVEGNYSLFQIEAYPAQCATLLKRMLDKDILKRPPFDDCLKEIEAVRYAARTMKSTLTGGESQRWAGMISRINSRVDTLKSVGSIKYSREEKIGTGSSGSHIFGGKFGNKTVAVKKLISEYVQRESELYNLMKTKTMSNVLKILHVEEDDDFTYIVTDLCEYDLKAVIEDTKNPIGARLSPEKRVKLCVDILRGLRDLHSIDVIHRDLKPSNILVGVDGEAYVADFGISRNLSGETTHATGFYGTLCWIAREGMQSKTDKVRYKKESDVQVAGCLMYYLLSNGHHPFEATFPFINDTARLMSNVAEGSYSLFHVGAYPTQCATLLKRMLDKDMSKRPSIDDCLEEMEDVRYTARTMKSILTTVEFASSATVAVPNTAYLLESEISDEFSKLIVKISSNLTRRNCVFLARYFNFSRAKIAAIKEESQTPGLDLLDTLIERNKINKYDLTNLQKALVDLQLNEINETLLVPYQSTIDPRTHEQHKILPQTP